MTNSFTDGRAENRIAVAGQPLQGLLFVICLFVRERAVGPALTISFASPSLRLA